jgi:hypothetical protein
LVHSLAGAESGLCFAIPHFSRSHRFPPSTPQRASPSCSPTSSVLPVSLTSPARTSSASALRLPDAGRRRIPPPAVKLEISRFPRKERACMPGSPTTPGRPRACAGARRRIAFRYTDSVGTRNQFSFAAQWLACMYPCRRFADTLTDACARLGVDVARYTFIAVDLHHLLLAGLPAHLCKNSIAVRFREY